MKDTRTRQEIQDKALHRMSDQVGAAAFEIEESIFAVEVEAVDGGLQRADLWCRHRGIAIACRANNFLSHCHL
jgi:hypothetical protein